jgi:glutamate/aspartate transport system substrate-binding protein
MFKQSHRYLTALVVSSCFVGVFATAAYAAAPLASPTLDSIKSSGVLTVGVRDNSYPFSYLDNNNAYLGYSVEISNAIIAAIKQKLNTPNLQVRQLAITSQNRIPLLQNNQIQYECSSTTNNKDREKQVNFSTTIFEIGTRLLVNKTSGIKSFSDLKGKTVVTVAGSTSERLLREMNDRDSMGMHIISSTDSSTSFVVLETGRAVAYMMDDAVLAGARATARDPSAWEIVAKPVSHEAYGCMLPKDDAGFKALVDGVIKKRELDGTETANYKKWFMSPTPPKNVNLNFEMSDDMKQLYAHPNDTPFQ